MKTLNNLLKVFRDKSGATAIEYGLIAACSATAIVGGASALGPSANSSFTRRQRTGLGLVRALDFRPGLLAGRLFLHAKCIGQAHACAAWPFCFGWSGPSAQPDSVTNSKVARIGPSGSLKRWA